MTRKKKHEADCAGRRSRNRTFQRLRSIFSPRDVNKCPLLSLRVIGQFSRGNEWDGRILQARNFNRLPTVLVSMFLPKPGHTHSPHPNSHPSTYPPNHLPTQTSTHPNQKNKFNLSHPNPTQPKPIQPNAHQTKPYTAPSPL